MKKLFVAIAVLLVAFLSIGVVSAAADQAFVTVKCNADGANITLLGENNTVLDNGIVSGGEANFKVNLPAKITAIKASASGYSDITVPVNETLTAGALKEYSTNLEPISTPLGGNAGIIQIKVFAKNIYNLKETPFSNATVQLYDVGGNLIDETTTSATGIVEFRLNTTATPASYVKVIPSSVGTEIKTIQVTTPDAGKTVTYNAEYTDTTQPASTPFPILGILAGLGVAGILLARRNH